MNKTAVLKKTSLPVWTAEVLAFLGLLVYVIQAAYFAFTTVSNLDEGAYLLKGYLFATGEYQPFDTGILTNKPPLAFLIPGYAQLLFGAGLRTGRYVAAAFGILAVLGAWVAARRISNKWLAAATVWVFAFSPMVIKFYSGSTQSLIACLLAWSLALSLGEERSFGELSLAGFFAGLMIFVRQNMLPVLPLLILYALWQHGRKAWGMIFFGAGIVFALTYAYWPQIFQVWTWFPVISSIKNTAPVIKEAAQQTEYAGGGTAILWQPKIDIQSRLLSFAQALRFHFIPLAGVAISLLHLPKIKAWKSRADLGAAVFLFVLYILLLYMHATAALALDYCTYCLSPYLAFFNVAGILWVALAVKSWQTESPRKLSAVLTILIFLIAAAAIGYSAFEEIGAPLLNLPAPRIRDLQILPGWTTWRQIIANKFALEYNLALRYASAAFGLAAGILITVIGTIIWRGAWRQKYNFGIFIAGMFLLSGMVFTSLAQSNVGDCASNVIAANEQNGARLRRLIPPGSVVYWDGGLSVAPLLYLPDVEIFPAQINAGYAFLSGADTAQAQKFGYWNEELKEQWKASANFFIIEERYYLQWKEFFDPQTFDELQRSPLGTSCLPKSNLRIFRRK